MTPPVEPYLKFWDNLVVFELAAAAVAIAVIYYAFKKRR